MLHVLLWHFPHWHALRLSSRAHVCMHMGSTNVKAVLIEPRHARTHHLPAPEKIENGTRCCASSPILVIIGAVDDPIALKCQSRRFHLLLRRVRTRAELHELGHNMPCAVCVCSMAHPDGFLCHVVHLDGDEPAARERTCALREETDAPPHAPARRPAAAHRSLHGWQPRPAGRAPSTGEKKQ